jgi:hypothetical protein
MIWIQNEEFLLCGTDKGYLLVFSLINNKLETRQFIKLHYDNLNIFSLQLSISNPHEILLSTNKGVIFVQYTYD